MNKSAARVSVVEQVWFQTPNDQPFAINLRMGCPLNTEEQPFTRRKTLTEVWEELETGWVKDPAFVIIENQEGKRAPTVLSPPEKLNLASKVIWVSLGKNDGLVHLLVGPGEHLRLPLNRGVKVFVRSANGSLKITTHALPGERS